MINFKEYFINLIKEEKGLTDEEIENKMKIEKKLLFGKSSDEWALHQLLVKLGINTPESLSFFCYLAEKTIKDLLKEEVIAIDLYKIPEEKKIRLKEYLRENDIDSYTYCKREDVIHFLEKGKENAERKIPKEHTMLFSPSKSS